MGLTLLRVLQFQDFHGGHHYRGPYLGLSNDARALICSVVSTQN
jgi:hypothetical protein